MFTTRREMITAAGAASLATAAGSMTRAMAQLAPGGRERTVRTDVLEIGYDEHGPADGTPVILLHGFPYDVRSFDGCVTPLAESGHRVLVPYLRGYGPTLFLDRSAPKTAEQAALAQDVIDFADARWLERFATGGFDWGNGAA
jgi:pimeloyl-ACP methyl ester carboxylesterase